VGLHHPGEEPTDAGRPHQPTRSRHASIVRPHFRGIDFAPPAPTYRARWGEVFLFQGESLRAFDV
jgi:hypothetical protein